MCKEIDNYKKSHDFKDYFDMSLIDKDAEKLLKSFNLERDVTPIVAIAKKMGFKVYVVSLNKQNESLSGMIGISEELRESYNNDKIVLLNDEESNEHIRFTLAHELAHYIYDYDENLHVNGYFNKYNTLEAETNIERRANRFAASFMMPKTVFTKIFNQNKEIGMTLNSNIENLSNYFIVPITAVKLRIKELGLNG